MDNENSIRLEPLNECKISKKNKQPKEQIRFEFADKNDLTLDYLEMQKIPESNLEDIEELKKLIDDLPNIESDFSSNEKAIIEENSNRKKTLIENKIKREQYDFINLIQLSTKEIDELNLQDYFDYTISEFSKKKHKHLFVNKDMLADINRLKDKFPNFNKVIDYIITHAFFCYKKKIPLFLPAINLNGDPSIGKTFFSKILSRTLQTDFYSLPVSTLISSHELTGLSRYWGNAGTGLLFNNLIKKAHYAESLLLLDEICKANYYSNNNGSNIGNVLITLLDKEQAKELTETCLDIEMNMSRTLIISTSNHIEAIPDVLRSRIVNFNIEKPNKEQLNVIIQSITDDILKELSISDDELRINIDKETSDLFYGKDLRDAREVLKNHIMNEYMATVEIEPEKPYRLYH